MRSGKWMCNIHQIRCTKSYKTACDGVDSYFLKLLVGKEYVVVSQLRKLYNSSAGFMYVHVFCSGFGF